MSDPTSQGEKIAQLAARVQTLEKATRLLSADLTKCVEALSEAQKDAYQRIKQLELAVFPKAVGDLADLNKIVPFTNEGSNDLDKRKP